MFTKKKQKIFLVKHNITNLEKWIECLKKINMETLPKDLSYQNKYLYKYQNYEVEYYNKTISQIWKSKNEEYLQDFFNKSCFNECSITEIRKWG